MKKLILSICLGLTMFSFAGVSEAHDSVLVNTLETGNSIQYAYGRPTWIVLKCSACMTTARIPITGGYYPTGPCFGRRDYYGRPGYHSWYQYGYE